MKSKTGKIAIFILEALLIVGLIGLFCWKPKPASGATNIYEPRAITITAVDSTPLDGSTSGRTYQPKDRTAEYSYTLRSGCDGVIITAYGTGSENDTAVFNIWGYPLNGPAQLIYGSVTATLGSAVADSGKLYVDTFSGTDVHISPSGVTVADVGNNRVAKISFDTMGYQYLMFECTTFTSLTNITFVVQEVGYR